MEATKKCSKCGKVKNVGEFRVASKQTGYLSSRCKKCEAEQAAEYRRNNPEKAKASKDNYRNSEKGQQKEREYDKKYQAEHKEERKAKKKIYLEENKEKIREYKKEYRERHKKEIAEYNKYYKDVNRDKINAQRKEYRDNPENEYYKRRHKAKVKKINSDSFLKFKEQVRRIVYKSLKRKNYSKDGRTHEILGCSYEFFKGYIEGKFQKGMTWDNYGEWEYDHIIPLSIAVTEEEVIRLNHYTNFQPLWKKDNIVKSNTIEEIIQLKFI